MSLPIALGRQDDFSLQEQIYRFIRDQVLSGTYPTGVRLPSTRDLAMDLRVSRTTVLLAYEWLMSEGYIETHKGLEYVEVGPPMLGRDGKPRPELFVQDGLHLTPEGYKLWTGLLRPHLK